MYFDFLRRTYPYLWTSHAGLYQRATVTAEYSAELQGRLDALRRKHGFTRDRVQEAAPVPLVAQQLALFAGVG